MDISTFTTSAGLFSYKMPVIVCVLVLLLLFTSAILQIGSSLNCNIKVAIMNSTKDKTISCFNKMRGEPCNIHRSTSYCNIEEKNGEICIKWSEADMTCMNGKEITKVSLEDRCAQDQESLKCGEEFTGPVNAQKGLSPMTTLLGGVPLVLFVSLFFYPCL